MKRHIKKVIKKSNKKVLLLIVIFLLFGACIGFGSVALLTQNDTFEIIGEKNITLNLNETYNEQGVKVISFGKDLKDKVIIESNVDITKEGQYTIVYTVKSFRYQNIKRVRYVTVMNGSDANE